MSSKTTSTTKSGAFLSTPNTSKLHWTGRLMYRHDTSSHFAYADNTRPTLDMACWLWCWDNNAAHSHFDQWTAEYCAPALGRSAHTYLTDPRVNDAHCDKMPASYINLPIVTGIQPTALCRKRPHCRFMEAGHLLNALWVDHWLNVEWLDNTISIRTFIPSIGTQQIGMALPQDQRGSGLTASTPVSDAFDFAQSNEVLTLFRRVSISQRNRPLNSCFHWPIDRPPYGVLGLTVLNDETVECQVNTCHETQCRLAMNQTSYLKPWRKAKPAWYCAIAKTSCTKAA